jgi:hypothetical protein
MQRGLCVKGRRSDGVEIGHWACDQELAMRSGRARMTMHAPLR